MLKFTAIVVAVLILVAPNQLAFGQDEFTHPSNFSVITAVPRGCLETVPTLTPIPEEQILLSGVVQQPVAVPNLPLTRNVDVLVKIWRHGCHDSNRSAIMMNLSLAPGIDENLLLSVNMRPTVSLNGSAIQDPLIANLWQGGYAELFHGAIGIFGFLREPFPNGVTYVLDTASYTASGGQFEGLVERYNSAGELRIAWGNEVVTADLPAYNPSIDRPQKSKPTFTGRMTGQWTAEGLPATGLLLQIGEIPKQYRNYVFAIWFTYIDGQPVWMAANKDIPVGTNEVTLDMGYFEGGKLFTTPGGFSSGDISAEVIGTMKLRVINCNEIEATTDFSSFGFGSNTLKLERLIRIAGYDCDGTQAIK